MVTQCQSLFLIRSRDITWLGETQVLCSGGRGGTCQHCWGCSWAITFC